MSETPQFGNQTPQFADQSAKFNEQPLRLALFASAILTVAIWLVVGTHISSFFPIPVDTWIDNGCYTYSLVGSSWQETFQPYCAVPGPATIRAIELVISTVAWILLAVAPLPILWAFRAGDNFVLKFLPVVALAWPVTVLIMQTTLRFQTGEWYLGYLFNSPAFLITEVVAPAAYFVIWRRLVEWQHANPDA